MSETLQVHTRRGITQRDVWLAIDAVVATGRRPTIDAVRQQLGRGSPNTVQAHLDSWFAHLGERLGEKGQAAVSPLPPFLTAAASHLWEAALDAAREMAAGELQDQRDLLAQETAGLDAKAEALRQEEVVQAARLEAIQASVQQSAEERAAADRREALALDRAGRLEAQINQLTGELEHAAAEKRALMDDMMAARKRLEDDRVRAEERGATHERHWLAEVERARQDVQKAAKAHASAESRFAAELTAAREALAMAERDLRGAQLEAAKAVARAESLERILPPGANRRRLTARKFVRRP